MPSIASHQSSETTKLLLIGDSGTGKTGSLASLALAGYNLRIIDVDNGLDILANLLKGNNTLRENQIIYETFTDKFKNIGGRMVPTTARVWPAVAKLLQRWKTEEYDLGPVEEWTAKEVLVIDSLTFLGHAAMRYQQLANGRLQEQPNVRDWGPVQSYIRDLLATLYSTDIKCNVIITSHITYMYEEKKDDKGWVKERELSKAYPSAPGQKLPPQIGSYFNSMLQTISRGKRHFIVTEPQGVVELKNSNPGRVKKEYPVETGLADFFKDVRS